MKKTLLLGLLVGTMATMAAVADQIKIEPNFGPYQTGNGGEFTVLPIGFNIEGYVSGVSGDFVEKGTFQTFCLELKEGINATTYDVTHGQVTKNSNVTLNKGTAWLYDQFKLGELGQNYDYADTGLGRKASAAKLQNEFWYLMGQIGTPDPLFDGIVNAAAVAGSWNVLDPSNGWLDVKVLNVWTVGSRLTGAKQDVLVQEPPTTPDGGLTLALLGMGLTGLGVVSRRVRK
jgi:hypothetical protein